MRPEPNMFQAPAGNYRKFWWLAALSLVRTIAAVLSMVFYFLPVWAEVEAASPHGRAVRA